MAYERVKPTGIQEMLLPFTVLQLPIQNIKIMTHKTISLPVVFLGVKFGRAH